MEDLDVGQIGAALKTRRWWIVGPTLLALVATFLAVNLIAPRYTGEARVLLESRDTFYTRPAAGDREGQGSFDAEAVTSQVQLITSRDLALQAIKRLGLVGNPEFDPLAGAPGAWDRVLTMIGLRRGTADRAPEERILDRYFDRLLVYPVAKSRVIVIEFTAQDRALAAKAANTVAELYLDQLQASKQEVARSASAWLSSTIEPLRKQVTEAESKVEEYRARAGLLVGSNNTTLTSQQLAELSAQLAAARTAQADTQAKAALMREMIRTGRLFEIPDVANNDLIRRLIEQRITLRSQLALESRTLLPEHPRIKELNAQLADLEAQIRAAAERTVKSLEGEATVAGARVDSLLAAIEAQKKLAVTANENEVQLRALEREARTRREQLEAYMVRYREAQARDAENAMPPDARIVSRAVEPASPSFPKKGPMLLIATLAAFFLSTAIIVSRELLSGRAFVPAVPVQPAVSTPVERPWPVPAFSPPAPAMAAARGAPAASDEAAAALDEILAKIGTVVAAGRGRLLVTEVGQGREGGRLAHALAHHLSRRARTILVSLVDVAQPAAEKRGFTDLVAGNASFAEIIEREGGTRLHTMSPGTHAAAALTQSLETVDLALSALDQTYDWVICVLPGAERATLAPVLAPRADGTILVAEGDAESPSTTDAYEELRRAGARDVVVALSEPGGDGAAPRDEAA